MPTPEIEKLNFSFGDQDCKENPCAVCGKEISQKSKTKYFIHYTCGGFIVPADVPEEALEVSPFNGSQGLFPIGADCKKTLSKKFVIVERQ